MAGELAHKTETRSDASGAAFRAGNSWTPVFPCVPSSLYSSLVAVQSLFALCLLLFCQPPAPPLAPPQCLNEHMQLPFMYMTLGWGVGGMGGGGCALK